MIHIFTPRASTGARDLAQAINAARPGAARRVRNLDRVRAGDTVVSWGAGTPAVPAGVRVINGVTPISKLTELRTLKEAGVRVPEFSPTRPVEADGWLARASDHVGGDDLLHPPPRPSFWTRWENLSNEFRVHVFKRRDGSFVSVRSGQKYPRAGVRQHPWIRSWDAGWHLLYDEQAQRDLDRLKGCRDAARAAVNALGLDFGAVDVGWVSRLAKPIVLEVNRAPGNEGQTSVIYAREILSLAGV